MDATKNSVTLTARRERFCQEYVIDQNASAAARRAGYSEGSAHVAGCRLLKDDNVAARIAALQAEVADRNKITVDGVVEALRRLRELAIDKKSYLEDIINNEPKPRTKSWAQEAMATFTESLEVFVQSTNDHASDKTNSAA